MIAKLERINKARIGNKSKISPLAMHPKQSMLRSRIKKKNEEKRQHNLSFCLFFYKVLQDPKQTMESWHPLQRPVLVELTENSIRRM
jgi:hypothetical protein